MGGDVRACPVMGCHGVPWVDMSRCGGMVPPWYLMHPPWVRTPVGARVPGTLTRLCTGARSALSVALGPF